MKIIFNDSTEMQIQSASESAGQLLIKIATVDLDTIRSKFSDELATKRMIIQERDQTIATYDNYSVLYRIEEYTGRIYQVVMYLKQATPEAQAEVQAAAVAVAQIQAQSLTDDQAISVKAIYPRWEDVIGQTVAAGYKFTYEDKLYKAIQADLTIQEQYIPGEGTESLYTCIDETHAGTVDDPIPYDGNMELVEGLYYIQNETIYKCTRSTGQPVYHALSDLIGIYVEVAA